MSPEEHQLLAGLFDRTRAAANTVRDRDAEAFIDDHVRAQPTAPYLLAQAVIVQEQALNAAGARLQELEARVQELEQQAARQQPAQSGGFLGGLGSIFGGGGEPPRAPQGGAPTPNSKWTSSVPVNDGYPPQQQGYGRDPYAQQGGGYPPQQGGYPPPQQGGPWAAQQPQPSAGGSFLKGALGVAAGVAGGALLANAVGGLLKGNHGSQGNNLGIGDGVNANSGNPQPDLSNIFPASNPTSAAQRDEDYQQDADQDQDDEQDESDNDDGDESYDT